MLDERRSLLAHLYRRAAFGARPSDIETYSVLGYGAAIEALFHPQAPASSKLSKVAARATEAIEKAEAMGDTADAASKFRAAQADWLETLVTTRDPLRERMTLFLSDHFATGYAPGLKVDAPALIAQQRKIRRHALGSFAELAHAMVDDLALACYLNNDRNSKKRPNENLGRELLELFLLGAGNYTEADVRETARALTGYTLKQSPIGAAPTLEYDAKLHDAGPKTILGVTKAFTPHSVVDHLLRQPAAQRFLATKLVKHFVSPAADPALVAAVATALHDWHLPTAMRTIFHSEQFRSPGVRFALAKSPAEYIVGTMRVLGRTDFDHGVHFMARAGQSLFAPPSVAGWPTGRSILGPASLLARYNAAAWFAQANRAKPKPGLPTDLNLSSWLATFALTDLSAQSVDALNAYLGQSTRQSTPSRIAGLVTLLATTPEYQLA